MTYAEKLRDPRWQRKRLEILQRDEFACRLCYDTTTTLHVHHRWYEAGKDPWDYSDAALITLCAPCHEDETNRLAESTSALVQELKRTGAMAGDFEHLRTAFPLGTLVECLEGRQKFVDCGADDWAVIAFGIHEVMRSWGERGTGTYDALRDRFYAHLRALRELTGTLYDGAPPHTDEKLGEILGRIK